MRLVSLKRKHSESDASATSGAQPPVDGTRAPTIRATPEDAARRFAPSEPSPEMFSDASGTPALKTKSFSDALTYELCTRIAPVVSRGAASSLVPLESVGLRFPDASTYRRVFSNLIVEEALEPCIRALESDVTQHKLLYTCGAFNVAHSQERRGAKSARIEQGVSSRHDLDVHTLRFRTDCPDPRRNQSRRANIAKITEYENALAGRHTPFTSLADIARGDVLMLTNDAQPPRLLPTAQPEDQSFSSGRGPSNFTRVRQGFGVAFVVALDSIDFPPASRDRRDNNMYVELRVSWYNPPVQGKIGTIRLHSSTGDPTSDALNLKAYRLHESSVVSSWREFDAVNATGANASVPGRSVLMQPSPLNTLMPTLLSPGHAPSPSSYSSSSGPESARVARQGSLTNSTPLPGNYEQHLSVNFNPSQLEAIRRASDVEHEGFTLVLGPPGTGKTLTLLGMLNTLHLKYMTHLYEKALPDPFQSPESPRNSKPPKESWIYSDAGNPHLLVVAPSNAAVDHVMRMTLERGFVDGTGASYTPPCVRLGGVRWSNSDPRDEDRHHKHNAPEAVDKVRRASLESQVQALLQTARINHDSTLADRLRTLESQIAGLDAECRHLSGRAREAARAHYESPSMSRLGEFHACCGRLVDYRNRARDLVRLQELLSIVRDYGGSSTEEDLNLRLRSLVLARSNIIFATLSQCGSPALKELTTFQSLKFHTVVIDEAAQAVEPSTLIPLSVGAASRCVLVGDPHQLPATVMSERALRSGFQQSLFERLLKAGHPHYLLDIQYRSRPEISSFSNRAFYESRLRDGESVRHPLYKLDALQRFGGPLIFFDVAFGSQAKSGDTSSYSNEAEVEVCKGIVEALRLRVPPHEAINPWTRAPFTIGVIAPYRAQIQALQRALRTVASLPGGGEVMVDTVDAFQGREMDVIVFSCVRAEADGSIGFLADQRRLNVAATRAKFGFFVVGHADLLCKRSKLWSSFVQHVRATGQVRTVTSRGQDLMLVR